MKSWAVPEEQQTLRMGEQGKEKRTTSHMATVEVIKKRSEEINWMRRQGTQLTKIHPILPLPTQNLHSLTLSSSFTQNSLVQSAEM